MDRLLARLFLPLFAGVLFAGCSGNGPESPDKDGVTEAKIASLEEQVSRMEGTVAALQDALNAANQELRADLEAQIRELSDALDQITGVDDFEGVLARLAALETQVSGNHAELSAKIEETKTRLQAELDGKADDAVMRSLIEELRAEFSGEIAKINTELSACIETIAGLSTSVTNLQNHIDAVQAALRAAVDGKVDKSDYDAFVRKTNEEMQVNAALLSELLAVCNGFSGNGSVKEYIDSAVSSLVSMLGDYVLSSTYETFIQEYGAFKSDIEGQIAANNALAESLKALLEDLKGQEGSIGDLSAVEMRIQELSDRIAALEKEGESLSKVKSLFSKETEEFLNGVNSIILDALSNNGILSIALAQSAETLRAEYTAALADIYGRLADLEGKIADLIGRIQSLVYVPKTSDGKIHMGTTYIAETDAHGNEVGERIELTSTKKLEYRVSPADLRDGLLELPVSCFSFYQEHVTRAVEGSGMDEFHIMGIEPGNGPGEIFIVVENEHDFTHEDLAVALCIKYTSDHGVATEFTSPYTTVTEDGRNLCDRFYLAKKYNGEWMVCRDDNVSYLLRYDDVSSTVSFTAGEYEIVYDNGECVMAIEEAAERFEWRVTEFNASAEGISGAFSNGIGAGSTVTPSDPNADRTKPVTVKLSTADQGNIRGKITDRYSVSLSDGQTTVRLIPEVNVSVTVIGASYVVDGGKIVWNSSVWAAGRNTGGTRYSTDYGTVESSVGPDDKTDMSHFPDSDLAEIFPRNAEWTVTKDSGEESTIQGNVTVTSGPVHASGKERSIQFSVNGYLYSDGTETVTLRRTAKPSGLAGSEGIEISASMEIEAPRARSFDVTQTISSSLSAAYMYYFSISDHITARNKIPSYSEEEIARFFGGDKGAVSSMLSLGSSVQARTWKSSDGTYSMPVRDELVRNEETGSTILVRSLIAQPRQISPALSETAVFEAPEGCRWNVPNGPSIPITGSVTVTAY